MSLKQFIAKGFIVAQATNKEELSRLLKIADRDIKESSENCHEVDWQFAIAYNAALQLATAILRASGYRASTKVGHHWATFTVLPTILGDEYQELADYFNTCRTKRNTLEYCDTGAITKQAAVELIQQVKAFKTIALEFLRVRGF